MSAPSDRLSEVRQACAVIRDSVSLSSIVAKSVKLRRVGHEWVGCCPFHADRSPSFTIYADDRRFQCFGCGAQGDVLDFVRRSRRVELAEAIRMIDSGALPAAARILEDAAPVKAERQAEALAIWHAALAPQGTPAELYLRRRGLVLPIPPAIRFARLPLGKRAPMPALVALITGAGGTPAAIQRTFLREDGRKADLPGGKVKFSLGPISGGAIRLGDVGADLIVTEGLEDGLTLFQEVGHPVWVAAGAGMMHAIRLPRVVKRITIGADRDATGEASARKAAAALATRSRAAQIMWPSAPAKDFNAQLTAARS